MEFVELESILELPEVNLSSVETAEHEFIDSLSGSEFSEIFFCSCCGWPVESSHQCFQSLPDVCEEVVHKTQRYTIFQPALASLGYPKILKRLSLIPEQFFGKPYYEGLSLRDAKPSYGILDALLDLFREFVEAKILSVGRIDLSKVYYCGNKCLVDPTGIFLSAKPDNRKGFAQLFERFDRDCVRILQNPDWERDVCVYLRNRWLYRNRVPIAILEEAFGFSICYRPIVEQFLIQLELDDNNLKVALYNFMNQPRCQKFKESYGNINFWK